jgi:hypothetical protein
MKYLIPNAKSSKTRGVRWRRYREEEKIDLLQE